MRMKISYKDWDQFPIELHPDRRYSFLIFLPWWLLVAVLLSLGFLWNNYWFIPALGVLLIALFRFLSLAVIRYLITEETVTVRRGIFSRQFDYLELFRIRDFRIRQSIGMRLMGVMNVMLYTTDLTNDLVALEALPKSDLPELLRDLTVQARLKNRIFEIN